MAHRNDLPDWIVEALRGLGGAGTIVEISRAVWDRHEDDLRESGDLFYTWQYDLRWAGLKLRKADVLSLRLGRGARRVAAPGEVTPVKDSVGRHGHRTCQLCLSLLMLYHHADPNLRTDIFGKKDSPHPINIPEHPQTNS